MTQTVSAGNAITPIVHTATNICDVTISSSNSGLPTGLVSSISNNVNTISGTVTSSAATGTFNFTITISGPSTSISETGTITVN